MLLQARCKGHAVTGLRIDHSNAQPFPKRDMPAIELHLDHLLIECGLPTGFWEGEAEICDWRLCAWLESKKHRGIFSRSVTVAMTPSGENAFRMVPVD